MESDMAIDSVSSRAEAADRRETARDAAHLYAMTRSDARRDQRIEEARASAAARPTPSERAAEMPPRPSTTARLVDVLA
jgi:hypothetical protein